MTSSIAVNFAFSGKKVTQKVIYKVGLFRFGLRKFQNEVNCALCHGWKIEHIEVKKCLFRYFCEAVLFKVDSLGEVNEAKCCMAQTENQQQAK
jgi:hypothetical protein